MKAAFERACVQLVYLPTPLKLRGVGCAEEGHIIVRRLTVTRGIPKSISAMGMWNCARLYLRGPFSRLSECGESGSEG